MLTYERIYAIVRQIPPGQVATYGQVAELAGLFGKPRLVGYALYRVDMDKDDVPWQRVINAQGKISDRPGAQRQRQRLAEEGILFVNDKVDLKRYQWQGHEPADGPQQTTLF